MLYHKVGSKVGVFKLLCSARSSFGDILRFEREHSLRCVSRELRGGSSPPDVARCQNRIGLIDVLVTTNTCLVALRHHITSSGEWWHLEKNDRVVVGQA